MDTLGWFIATTHQLLGHDKTAHVLGEPPGDKTACLICRYEANPLLGAERSAATWRRLKLEGGRS